MKEYNRKHGREKRKGQRKGERDKARGNVEERNVRDVYVKKGLRETRHKIPIMPKLCGYER